MNKPLTTLIGFFILCGAQPGFADTLIAPDNGSPQMDDSGLALPSFSGPTMDLRRWPENTFYQNFTEQVDILSSAHGIERTSVLLDFAELYLGQMMLSEAASVLEGLNNIDVSDVRRLSELRDAVRLLGGNPIEDINYSPLGDISRPDRAFWLTLDAIATGNAEGLYANLKGGFGAMAYQTPRIIRAMLPVFTEALVGTGELNMAKQALQLIDEVPDLSSAPVSHFLHGQVASLMGDTNSALQSYLMAAESWGQYAARSRLALADIALENGEKAALRMAQQVLEQGVEAWRGDQYELEILKRLAYIYSANNEKEKSLVIYGKLMGRFPNSPEMPIIKERAATDLEIVYENGVQGKLSLSHWLSLHLQLVSSYRYFPEFAVKTELLADRVQLMGATDLAATEYLRTLYLLEGLAKLSETPLEQERVFMLHIKIAQAQKQGGRLAEASDTLTMAGIPQTPQQRQILNQLRSTLAAELGDLDVLLRTHVENPDAGNIRDVAYALWSQEHWADAVIFYKRLWDTFPGQFNVDDATYLLIAAQHADDETTSIAVIDAFPGLTQSENWNAVAESLLEVPDTLLPLNRTAAINRLESLERTIENLKEYGL